VTERKTILDTMELRVLVKSLSMSCDALLRKMDRIGKSPELIAEYEQLDTLVIRARMELVEQLRK
jgi:hypothetical protein